MNSNKLSTLFWRSFDTTVVTSLVRQPGPLTKLGEGRHFQTYGLQSKPLPLVLKIPKGLWSNRASPQYKEWLSCMNAVKNVALIAPWHVIEVDDLWGLIMPALEDLCLWNQQEPLRVPVAAFFEALSAKGLTVADDLQIGFYQSTPYMVDVSDLVRVARRPF